MASTGPGSSNSALFCGRRKNGQRRFSWMRTINPPDIGALKQAVTRFVPPTIAIVTLISLAPGGCEIGLSGRKVSGKATIWNGWLCWKLGPFHQRELPRCPFRGR
jgi:hypothetical protein